jgi:hypothetical protein
MKKLTTREKTLLFVTLLVAAIALTIQFAIIPMYNAYSEKTDLHDRLLDRRSDLDAKLAREPAVVREYNRSLDLFAELGTVYPETVPNEDIDRLITRLIVSNGFVPMSLQIGAPTALTIRGADIEAPQETEEAEQRTMSALTTMREARSGGSPPPAQPAGDSTRAALLIVPVSMNIEGDYPSLKRLIAELNRTDYIRLTRVSYNIDAGAGLNATNIFAIAFEITMLNENLEF